MVIARSSAVLDRRWQPGTSKPESIKREGGKEGGRRTYWTREKSGNDADSSSNGLVMATAPSSAVLRGFHDGSAKTRATE